MLRTAWTEAWDEYLIGNGDTLSALFARAGASPTELANLIAEDPAAKDLHRIYPGQRLAFVFNAKRQLAGLRYHKSALETITWVRTPEGFSRSEDARTPEVQTAFRSAVIQASLLEACVDAGVPMEVAYQIARILGWDIDFTLDLRQGDRFHVLYEEQFLDGERIGFGDVLAVEFHNHGRTLQAVRYQSLDGHADYYTPGGTSMRKAFMRNPVDVVRISSGFNLQRRHPILHRIRAHKGVDYAAGRGTPVRTTGDGKILFAGIKGGYGNTLIVQHGQDYTTLYAHLNGFARGMGAGKRVKQGDIIGYVGSSGLATGPHLHYEFRMHGVHRNPLTVALPKATAINPAELARFRGETEPTLAKLTERSTRTTQLAQATLP